MTQSNKNKEQPHYVGHRNRLKEKFLKHSSFDKIFSITKTGLYKI